VAIHGLRNSASQDMLSKGKGYAFIAVFML
jgi:hypothetical protein